MKLGFLTVLTLIFITLKLTSVISWSWWFVLLPFYVILLLGTVVGCWLVAIGIECLIPKQENLEKKDK